MQVTWPLDKCYCLCQRIHEIITTTQNKGFVSCHLIAQALGLLHNGCAVLPLRAMLLPQIQHTFNNCITDHMRKGSSIWHQWVFWDSAEIHLTNHLRHDFKALRALLATGRTLSTTWTWPIGLLIPCKSQFMFFSNASHEGLGGWCPQLHLMWCITKAELVTLGFTMAVHSKPSAGDPPGILHINVLEFIALLVNVWFALATCHASDPLHQQHHISNFFTDNMLALSWMLQRAEQNAPTHADLLVSCKHFSLFPLFISSSNHITSQDNQKRLQTCCPGLHVQSCGDPLSELGPMICAVASLTKCSASCCQCCLVA